MKSTTYARLVLLLPYLTLVESVGYFKVYEYEYENAAVLQVINEFWNFFAFFWFIPYTILVIYLLIWSRRKTTEQIEYTYTLAPFMMMFVSIVSYLAILITGSLFDQGFYKGLGGILIIAAIVAVPASIIFGYIFVGISFLGYKFLQKLNLIEIET
jgi:hypothetical protein